MGAHVCSVLPELCCHPHPYFVFCMWQDLMDAGEEEGGAAEEEGEKSQEGGPQEEWPDIDEGKGEGEGEGEEEEEPAWQPGKVSMPHL